MRPSRISIDVIESPLSSKKSVREATSFEMNDEVDSPPPFRVACLCLSSIGLDYLIKSGSIKPQGSNQICQLQLYKLCTMKQPGRFTQEISSTTADLIAQYQDGIVFLCPDPLDLSHLLHLRSQHHRPGFSVDLRKLERIMCRVVSDSLIFQERFPCFCRDVVSAGSAQSWEIYQFNKELESVFLPFLKLSSRFSAASQRKHRSQRQRVPDSSWPRYRLL